MNIEWTIEALNDLDEIQAFIRERSPKGARRVLLAIHNATEAHLPDNSRAGRPGRIPGTRELVIPRTPYIVPYRVRDKTIEILRVYHGARLWPDDF